MFSRSIANELLHPFILSLSLSLSLGGGRQDIHSALQGVPARARAKQPLHQEGTHHQGPCAHN
jgi:hypothetical protein